LKNWRLVVACVCGPYVVGLTWGYFRLPWAALKSMSEYHTFANAPVVTVAGAAMALGPLFISITHPSRSAAIRPGYRFA